MESISHSYIINNKQIDIFLNKKGWTGVYYLPSKHKISYIGPSGIRPSEFFGEKVYFITNYDDLINNPIKINSTNGGPILYLYVSK